MKVLFGILGVGTMILCGREGRMEDTHVFSGELNFEVNLKHNRRRVAWAENDGIVD